MKHIFRVLVLTLILLLVMAFPVFAAPSSQEVAPAVEVSPAFLGSVGGAVLSLIFSYAPGLNVKFASLTPEIKRLVMLGVLMAVSLAVYALGCEGIIRTGISCGRTGILQLTGILISAAISNQSTYALTPLPARVRAAAAIAKEQAQRDATIGLP